jgi:hypothetical protein
MDWKLAKELPGLMARLKNTGIFEVCEFPDCERGSHLAQRQHEIYIQPKLIIRRMTFSETMEALDNLR